MRHLLLLILLVLPGLMVAAVSVHYALLDWEKLREAYAQYRQIAASGADLRAVFVANAAQETHRLNLFADGVWALQGLMVFGIGLVGLCLLPRRARSQASE